MLEEDHKVEESCAIKNNKEAFSVSVDILVSNSADNVFPILCHWGGIEMIRWYSQVASNDPHPFMKFVINNRVDFSL